MKKRQVKTLILIIVFSLGMGLIYAFVNLYSSKQAIEQELLKLPDVPLNDLDGNTFDLNQLDDMKLLVFMDTDCMYCKYQVEDLKNVRQQFQNINIIGISEQPIERLQAYIEKETFFNQPKTFITYDFSSNLANHYRIGTTPHLLIYDAQNQLIHQHKGYMKAEQLKALLKSAE